MPQGIMHSEWVKACMHHRAFPLRIYFMGVIMGEAVHRQLAHPAVEVEEASWTIDIVKWCKAGDDPIDAHGVNTERTPG